ncbi:MAG TPA: hypothetical protein VGR56_00440 [Nitrososphaerales archaeon]|nr:hypothetical protein [Nitrososphaerales archaeon]
MGVGRDHKVRLPMGTVRRVRAGDGAARRGAGNGVKFKTYYDRHLRVKQA